MKNGIYVTYNRLSNRYESVMSFPSDSMATHRLSQGRNFDHDEYELCRIGEYDIETGVVVPCPPVRLEWEKTELPTTEAENISK